MNSKFYVSREAAMLLREKGYDETRDFLTPCFGVDEYGNYRIIAG